MNFLLRLSVCAAFVLFCCTVLHWVRPGWVGELAVLPAALERLEHCHVRGAEYEQLTRQVCQRVQAKQELIGALVVGERTLQEVVLRFHELNQQPPVANRALLDLPYRGRTLEETCCGEVLANLEVFFGNDPCLGSFLREQLLREQQRLLASGGLQLSEATGRRTGE